jgi:diaminopimelate decarboxylase
MLVETAGRKVVGLHSHIGSGIDDTAPLLEAARRLLELSGSFPNLQWINFGGGFAVPYRPGDSDFPIDAYGADLTRIADPILRARNLTAIVEPGRYIVAESGVLLSRVTARRLSAGQWWIGCDTGFNHLVRPSKYGAYHHIVNASNGSDASLRTSFGIANGEDVVVAGNLCESGDVFTRDSNGTVQTRRLDRTKPGDIVAFGDVGAYGFSMASLYNARLLPAEVLIENSSARLIRERQTFEDLVRGQQ